MKKVIFILGLIIASSVTFAQTKVVRDANGNFTSVRASKSGNNDKKTGQKFTTSKGETFDVWESERGKLYVIRTAKESGNQYKQYLKVD
jgi:hypothetical protein